MPQIYHKFNGGVVNDPRSTQEDVFRMVTNFDVFTNTKKATPYRDSEDGDSAGSTSKKQKFEIALGASSTWRLFALGVVSGTGRAEILMKDLTTGASTDLDDNGWSTPSNNAAASGATSFNLFRYYKKTGRIYGASGGTLIWTFDPTGSAAFSDASHALTYTNIAQAVVHSKDDIMYLPYDNKIATNNNGSWNDTALTLPSHLYITSICEHGNFLAIGCAPLSGIGESRVYLWDRDSSLTTLTENIPWGTDTLKVLEDIEGYLVGISVSGNSSTRFKNRVTFRYHVGGSLSKQFDEFESSTAITLLIEKQLVNNRLYFMMNPTINGTKREGVWSIGISTSPSKPFSIVHERTPNNDTAVGTLKGFYFVGDYCFISYVTVGAVDALSKTNDQSSYTASSVIETVINFKMPDEDKPKKKKIGSVICTYEPLPANGSVVMKYKVDGGSYITIFTETTDNAVSTERTKTAANGFITDGREYEFQVISTGGAEITGIGYDYSILKTHTK